MGVVPRSEDDLGVPVAIEVCRRHDVPGKAPIVLVALRLARHQAPAYPSVDYRRAVRQRLHEPVHVDVIARTDQLRLSIAIPVENVNRRRGITRGVQVPDRALVPQDQRRAVANVVSLDGSWESKHVHLPRRVGVAFWAGLPGRDLPSTHLLRSARSEIVLCLASDSALHEPRTTRQQRELHIAHLNASVRFPRLMIGLQHLGHNPPAFVFDRDRHVRSQPTFR